MSTSARPVPIEVTLRGNVGTFAGEYARDKVSTALSYARTPVARPISAVASVSASKWLSGAPKRCRASLTWR